MELISVNNVTVSTFENGPMGATGKVSYSIISTDAQKTVNRSLTTLILICYNPLYCEVHYQWVDENDKINKVIKRYAGVPFITTERL